MRAIAIATPSRLPSVRQRVRIGWLQHSYALTAVALLVVLLIVAAIRGPRLFTLDGIVVFSAVAAPLILATMALTPVAIAGRGGIDLSVGPLMSLINVGIVVWLVGNDLLSPYVVVPFAFGIALGAACVHGLLVSVVRLQPIIVTLAGFLVYGGLALHVLPQPGGEIPVWLADLARRSGPVPNALIVVAGTCLVWWAISRSTFFRHVRLLGGSERAAFASGIPLVRTQVGAYMIGALFAAMAALMFTALLASGDPTQGTVFTLTSIAALALGGTSLAGGRGGMIGSVAGAIDIFLINYILGTFSFGIVSAYVVQLSYGSILLSSLILGAVALRYSRMILRGLPR